MSLRRYFFLNIIKKIYYFLILSFNKIIFFNFLLSYIFFNLRFQEGKRKRLQQLAARNVETYILDGTGSVGELNLEEHLSPNKNRC